MNSVGQIHLDSLFMKENSFISCKNINGKKEQLFLITLLYVMCLSYTFQVLYASTKND